MARDTISITEAPGRPPDLARAFQDPNLVQQTVEMLNEHAETLDALETQLAPQPTITGETDTERIDAIIAALTALGLVTAPEEE